MPEKITINDFSAGWIASDDAHNGRKNGLLRMQGVRLDENGALVLQGGTQKGSVEYPAEAHTLFYKLFCGERRAYVALKDGSVWRNDTELIAAGEGSIERAAFGVFGNDVLIFSGDKRIKDTCDEDISGTDLSLEPPDTAPLINQFPPSALFEGEDLLGAYANFTAVTGAVAVVSSRLEITVSNDVIVNKTAYIQNFNLSDFPADYAGAPKDTFVFRITAATSLYRLLGFSVTFFLEAAGTDVSNFYTFEWSQADILAAKIDDYTAQLSITRDQFIRKGETSTLDWQAVYGVAIGVAASSDAPDEVVRVEDAKIYSSAEGNLNGTYTWLQVNVRRSGNSVVLSIPGPETAAYTVLNSYVEIIPEDPTLIEPQANEVWIYRRGGTLEQYYRIATMVYGELGPIYDDMSDSDARRLNVTLDSTTVPIDTDNLAASVIEMVGPIFNRMAYFTNNQMIVSAINSPDRFSPRHVYDLAGDESEKFQFARKVSENIIMVGTTRDVYVVTGTFTTFPDGALDLYIRPLGTNKPPMSRFATVWNGQLIYFASQDWIKLSPTGQYISLTAGLTDELYAGRQRYEFGGVPTYIDDLNVSYACAVAKNKLWVVVPTITDYTSLATINDRETWEYRLEIFDLVRNVWFTSCYSPYLLAVSDDEAIYGFMKDSNLVNLLDNPFGGRLNSTTGL